MRQLSPTQLVLGLFCIAAATMMLVGSSLVQWNDAQSLNAPSPRWATEILDAVCPGNHAANPSVMMPGCKSCPAFTEWGSLGIGKKSSFDLERIVYGSFSAPRAQEAVATFEGCVDRAHAANFRTSVVLEKLDDEWRVEAYGYHEGIDASKCQPFNLQNGRQILVCQSFEGHQDFSFDRIFRWDFQAKDTWRDLITTINTWGACREAALQESIASFEIQSLPGDRLPIVRIKVSVVQVRRPGNLGVCGLPAPPPATNYQVDFVFTNGDFFVASWSRSIKQHLDALLSLARQ